MESLLCKRLGLQSLTRSLDAFSAKLGFGFKLGQAPCCLGKKPVPPPHTLLFGSDFSSFKLFFVEFRPLCSGMLMKKEPPRSSRAPEGVA